jgi:hypothetical protein
MFGPREIRTIAPTTNQIGLVASVASRAQGAPGTFPSRIRFVRAAVAAALLFVGTTAPASAAVTTGTGGSASASVFCGSGSGTMNLTVTMRPESRYSSQQVFFRIYYDPLSPNAPRGWSGYTEAKAPFTANYLPRTGVGSVFTIYVEYWWWNGTWVKRGEWITSYTVGYGPLGPTTAKYCGT